MTATITVYGIKNCDTIKKARAWLDGHGVGHVFHDYKQAGVDPGLLRGWVAQAGWQAVLNRAGTSFRQLPEAAKAVLGADGPVAADGAVALMLANPSMIKRPVLVRDDKVLIGFKPDIYAAFFT